METVKKETSTKTLTPEDKKTLGQEKSALAGDKKLPKAGEKEKLVATDKSAADILDPANPKQEAGTAILMPELPKGAIYPTEEALKREAESKQKDLKGPDMKKTAEANKSRSAIDPNHTSVIHPGALPPDEKDKK